MLKLWQTVSPSEGHSFEMVKTSMCAYSHNGAGLLVEFHLSESCKSIENREILSTGKHLKNVSLLRNGMLISYSGFVQPSPIDADVRFAITINHDYRGSPRTSTFLDDILR